MTKGSDTWYSCVLTEFNPESCLNNYRCELMLKVLKTISLAGALFNLLPFIIICFETRLRKAPYLGFLLLAVPDFVSLLLKYLSIQLFEILKDSSESVRFVYNILMISANFSSVLHIIMLSLQQLMSTALPLKCNIWITKKSLFFSSIVAWSVSVGTGVLFTFKMARGQIEEKETFLKVFVVIIMVFPVALLGISQLLILFIKKHMRTSNTENNNQNNRNSNKKAFRITSMMVVAYLLTTTPLYVKEVIQFFVCFITDPWFFVVHHVGTSLALANHALHPLVYTFNVVKFRSIYRNCLAKKTKCVGHTLKVTAKEERNNPAFLTNYRSSS